MGKLVSIRNSDYEFLKQMSVNDGIPMAEIVAQAIETFSTVLDTEIDSPGSAEAIRSLFERAQSGMLADYYNRKEGK